MEYFKEEYVTVSYEASLDLATITWNVKFLTHAQYQKATLALVQLILDKNCTRCICDTTHMGVMPVESQHWTNEVLTPKYMNSQLQCMAIVVSKDIFNKAAVANIVRKANNTQMATTFFDSYKEALEWSKKHRVQSTAA